MTNFEHPFNAREIDQQLEQFPSSTSENRSQTQLLAEIQLLHRAAAQAEKRSLMSAWQQIEYRLMQQQEPSQMAPRPLSVLPAPASFNPRAPQRRRLMTLVAVLLALLLIGGSALIVAQVGSFGTKSASDATPGATTSVATPVQTPTVVYTNKIGDNSMFLAWSPDGKRLLTAGNAVHIWDATTGQHAVVYQPTAQNIPVQNAAWAPDNSQRVAVTDGTSVRIIDGNSGNLLLTYPPIPTTGLTAFHPVKPLSQGSSHVGPIAWSPNGNEIASSVVLVNPARVSRMITIWNSHTGAVIKQWSGATDDIYELAWSPDGKYLAAVSEGQDQAVRLWNAATGTLVYQVQPTGAGSMERLAWSPNGQYLAVQREVQVGDNTLGLIVTRNEIQVWQSLTHKVIATYDASPDEGFSSVSWAADSERIATILNYNILVIWNAHTDRIQESYASQPEATYSQAAWSPNGKYIAVAITLRLGTPGPNGAMTSETCIEDAPTA
jgi:Tol biopolymer transport system component